MKIVLTKEEVKDIVLEHISSIYDSGINKIEIETYSDGNFATLETVEEPVVEDKPINLDEIPF